MCLQERVRGMNFREPDIRWPAYVLGAEITTNCEWQYLIWVQISVVHPRGSKLDRAKHPLALEEGCPEDFAVIGAGNECWAFPKWQDVIVSAASHEMFQISDI